MDIMREIGSRASALRLNAHKAAECKRLQNQLDITEAARQKLVAQIGQAYLDSIETKDTETLSILCASWEQMQKDLKHLTERMEQLNGYRHCPVCGRERRHGDAFCPSCGEKLYTAPPQETSSAESSVRRVYITWPEQNTPEE